MAIEQKDWLIFSKPKSVPFNPQSPVNCWCFVVGYKLRAFLHGEELFLTHPSMEPPLPSDYNVWEIKFSLILTKPRICILVQDKCLLDSSHFPPRSHLQKQLLTCDLNSAPLLLKRVVYGIILKLPFFKIVVGDEVCLRIFVTQFSDFTNVQELYKQKHKQEQYWAEVYWIVYRFCSYAIRISH